MSSSDAAKLPQDVVVEILKRLPVEYLLRYRCVSRSWRSTIDDPRFAALHLNHSARDASNWYLVCLHLWDPVQRLCSLFSNESLTLPSKLEIEVPFITPPDCYVIVGSCNGLICITEISINGFGKSNTMYVWNLFTRRHKAVLPGHQSLSAMTSFVVQGFGFDARSNDYKIVRILCFPNSERKPEVEIYSLRTDCWRSWQCEVPAFRCFGRKGIFLNGNLHWFASKVDDLWEGGTFGYIVVFDVAGEVFDEMALPEEISGLDIEDLKIDVAVLNDMLAMFISFMEAVVDPEQHFICSVWVMSEYGASKSWTKLYSFEAWGAVSRFDGFMRNGELLMEIDHGGLVSWNPITSQYTNLPQPTQCDFINVVESLVSL